MIALHRRKGAFAPNAPCWIRHCTGSAIVLLKYIPVTETLVIHSLSTVTNADKKSLEDV